MHTMALLMLNCDSCADIIQFLSDKLPLTRIYLLTQSQYEYGVIIIPVINGSIGNRFSIVSYESIV